MKLCKSPSFAITIAAALLLHGAPLPLVAQSAPATPGLGLQAVPLKVSVLTDPSVINSSKKPTPQTLSVRVERPTGEPVQNAVVVFNAPAYGATGTFLDDLKTLEVTTNAQGVATASGFRANSVPGTFAVQIKAVHGTETGFAAIQENNNLRSSGMSAKTWWIIGAVVVAGAAGGTAAALHNGGSSSSTSISAGGVTVGAPH